MFWQYCIGFSKFKFIVCVCMIGCSDKDTNFGEYQKLLWLASKKGPTYQHT
jgi:hypothetical protein